MYYSLLDDYKKFESIMRNHRSGSKEIDASYERFLAPTTLIPLLCEQQRRKIYIKLNEKTYGHVKKIIDGVDTLTNTPYQVLPRSEKERQDKQLSHKMARMIDNGYGGYFVLRHVLSELTNNIYNHTPFEEELASQGYTYAQEYPNYNKLDICIMDDGLSIPGRFKKSGILFKNECHAIEKAISNVSTESSDGIKRGNGLWTTLKLVVEGNGGSALIVSGRGCLYINDSKNYKYDRLDNEDMFKGTLISLRLNKKEVQDIYNSIELFEHNPYKY